MRYLLLILLTITTGCGKELVKEKELLIFAEKFSIEMGVKTDEIELTFEALETNTMGVCYKWTNGDRQIKVSTLYWNNLDLQSKTQLMYHELGHCALDLKHDDTLVKTPDNLIVYGSIMYPSFFGNTYAYRTYESKYKEALKNKTVISF